MATASRRWRAPWRLKASSASPSPGAAALREISRKASSVCPLGVFPDLAAAAARGDPFPCRQRDGFEMVTGALTAVVGSPEDFHLANGAGWMDEPPAWLTLVRP